METPVGKTRQQIAISSQLTAARVAGFTGLFTIAIVVVSNFALQNRLIVEGNIAGTASNILAHQSMFRLSILLYMLYSMGLMILLTAVYIILRPIDRGLSLAGTLLKFVYALIWIPIVLNSFTTLHILQGGDYLKFAEPEKLQALAKTYLSGFDEYYVGLLFWSTASSIFSYLWFRSNYIPKALAAFGFISSVWCVACTIVYIVFPDFSKTVNAWWFDSPMAIFELIISSWLLFGGIRIRKTD
jgi:hypothetical protein